MEDRPDLYVIVGVSPNVTPEELRDAYRTRVRLLHPDRFDRTKNPVEWAAANEMLRELNAAYGVLSDPASRGRYDHAYLSSTRIPPGADERSRQPTAASPTEASVRLRQYWPYGYAALIVLALLLASQANKSKAPLASEGRKPSDIVATEVSLPLEESRIAEAEGGLGSRSPSSMPASTLPPTATLPVCADGEGLGPLPENGAHWRYHQDEAVAPLEVRTSPGGQYLVKLERNGQAVAKLFVADNSSAEMLMPLGRYTLKYAIGKGQDWCGEAAAEPFGSGFTSFFKADEDFYFRVQGDQYAGYVVELILQQGGNLETNPLAPEDW